MEERQDEDRNGKGEGWGRWRNKEAKKQESEVMGKEGDEKRRRIGRRWRRGGIKHEDEVMGKEEGEKRRRIGRR